MAIADELKNYWQQMQSGMQGLGQRMEGFGPALEKGFANPMTHLGLGLLAGSQPGGAGWAAGAQQGMQGYQQMADAAATRDYRKSQLDRQKAQDEAEQARRLAVAQALKENPDALSQLRQRNPVSASILEATGDISALKGTEAFGIFDPYRSAQVENWQAQRVAEGERSDIARERMRMQDLQFRLGYNQKLKELGLKENQFGFDLYKQQETERKEREEKELQARVSNVNFGQQLEGVDQMLNRLDQFAGHGSFDMLYGPAGAMRDAVSAIPGAGEALGLGVDAVTSMLGAEYPDARALRTQLINEGFLREFQNIKDMSETGSAGFGALDRAEGKRIESAFSRLQEAQSPEAARKAVVELRNEIISTRNRMVDRAAASTPAGMQPPSAPPAPGAPQGSPQGSPGTGARLTPAQVDEMVRRGANRGVGRDQVLQMLRDQGFGF